MKNGFLLITWHLIGTEVIKIKQMRKQNQLLSTQCYYLLMNSYCFCFSGILGNSSFYFSSRNCYCQCFFSYILWLICHFNVIFFTASPSNKRKIPLELREFPVKHFVVCFLTQVLLDHRTIVFFLALNILTIRELVLVYLFYIRKLVFSNGFSK